MDQLTDFKMDIRSVYCFTLCEKYHQDGNLIMHHS